MATTKKTKASRSAKLRRRAAPRIPANPRKHEVKADLKNFELAKARSSLNLNIYANDEKIGELEIGRGSLYWYGRSRHRSKRIDWSRFAEMMDELAYGG
jgi:hypothetical protein